MMEKQVQFGAFNNRGEMVIQPLLLERGLEKTAEAFEMRSKLHPRVQDFVRAVRPTGSGIYVLVNALGAGEYWGSNVNGDLFPEKGLIHAPANWEGLLANPDQAREVGTAWPFGYPTFMGAYPYKHHVNKDPSRAFGRVELATWNPKMHRVELVVYLDRARCMQFDAMDIIERIEQGEFPDVSMGCKVPYDVCTICENPSKTRNDYCEHALRMMNKILPDGRKVAVRNDHPKFFDISFVFIGADKTAKVMAKLAQKGNQVCMGDFCAIPRLSADVAAELSKEAIDKSEIIETALGASIGAFGGYHAGKYLGKKSHEFYQRHGIAWKGKAEDNRQKALRIVGGLEGALLGSLGPTVLKSIVKTADPVDELDNNFGFTKDKAQADQENEKRAPGLRKFTRPAYLPTVEKYASAKLAWETFRDNPSPGDDGDLVRQGDAQPGGLVFPRYKTLGNYLKEKRANDPIKKKVKVQGVPIWIEWLKGETREYKKGGVVKYSRLMKADYGYIPGTVDSDGEELDVYLGPDRSAKNAYVIRQMKRTGGFDEHKVMIGYSSKSAAKASYTEHMSHCPECFGGMQAIPMSSLVALFGDNKGQKEKTASACPCHGVGDDCGGSIEKLGALLFPISKSASHAKLSEIIKSLPAGPFTRETLPKLESAEQDLPPNVLNMMGEMPLGSALSTPTMAGMVLKPREFQRVILMSIGERPLADELDSKGMTFGKSDDVDDSIQLDEGSVDDRLMNLLRRMGLVGARSAAAPALQSRSAATAGQSAQSSNNEKVASGPLMRKLSAAYNGYRRSVLRKAASMSSFMTTDPQLRAELFGSGMAQAFAGGIDKVANASVLSPDSLAYLVGAYTDRGLHMTNEVVASLALTGAVVEAA